MSETPRKPNLVDFLLRQPFALIGAIGLLSLAHDLLQFRQWIATWIGAFQTVTRPVWDFLMGWFFRLTGAEFPPWLKDYLTVGVIVFGMTVRAKLSLKEETRPSDIFILLAFLLQCLLYWPLVFLIVAPFASASLFLTGHNEDDKIYARAYWETGVWALIIVAVNYALLSGAR